MHEKESSDMASARTARDRPAKRRLVRSTNERWIAGVCGGLGHYLGISAGGARVLWIVLSLFPGPMWLLYVALWIFLPEEPT